MLKSNQSVPRNEPINQLYLYASIGEEENFIKQMKWQQRNRLNITATHKHSYTSLGTIMASCLSLQPIPCGHVVSYDSDASSPKLIQHLSFLRFHGEEHRHVPNMKEPLLPLARLQSVAVTSFKACSPALPPQQSPHHTPPALFLPSPCAIFSFSW